MKDLALLLVLPESTEETFGCILITFDQQKFVTLNKLILAQLIGDDKITQIEPIQESEDE